MLSLLLLLLSWLDPLRLFNPNLYRRHKSQIDSNLPLFECLMEQLVLCVLRVWAEQIILVPPASLLRVLVSWFIETDFDHLSRLLKCQNFLILI